MADHVQTIRLAVPEMSCGHCRAAITEAVLALDPGAAVDCDLGARLVTITSAASPAGIGAALQAAGYESRTA